MGRSHMHMLPTTSCFLAFVSPGVCFSGMTIQTVLTLYGSLFYEQSIYQCFAKEDRLRLRFIDYQHILRGCATWKRFLSLCNPSDDMYVAHQCQNHYTTCGALLDICTTNSLDVLHYLMLSGCFITPDKYHDRLLPQIHRPDNLSCTKIGCYCLNYDHLVHLEECSYHRYICVNDYCNSQHVLPIHMLYINEVCCATLLTMEYPYRICM